MHLPTTNNPYAICWWGRVIISEFLALYIKAALLRRQCVSSSEIRLSKMTRSDWSTDCASIDRRESEGRTIVRLCGRSPARPGGALLCRRGKKPRNIYAFIVISWAGPDWAFINKYIRRLVGPVRPGYRDRFQNFLKTTGLLRTPFMYKYCTSERRCYDRKNLFRSSKVRVPIPPFTLFHLSSRTRPRARHNPWSRTHIASQCMDIHRNPRISEWISIIASIIGDWYPYKMDIHLWIYIKDIHCGKDLHGYPCLDINVDIHACMDNWRLASKNHGYPCWYPWIFWNSCMDLLWILGLGWSLVVSPTCKKLFLLRV